MTWAVLILPYMEQEALHALWDLRAPLAAQTPQARNGLVPGYFCPTRRSPMLGKTSTLDPVSGGLSDYAVCASNFGNATTGGQGDTATSPANGIFVVGDVINPDPSQNDNPGGTNNVLEWRARISVADVLDGTSNTLLAGEKNIRLDELGVAQSSSGVFAGDGTVYSGDNNATFCSRICGPTKPMARFINELPISNNTRGQVFGSYHPGICQFVIADASVRALRTNMSGTIQGRLAARKDGEPVTFD